MYPDARVPVGRVISYTPTVMSNSVTKPWRVTRAAHYEERRVGVMQGTFSACVWLCMTWHGRERPACRLADVHWVSCNRFRRADLERGVQPGLLCGADLPGACPGPLPPAFPCPRSSLCDQPSPRTCSRSSLPPLRVCGARLSEQRSRVCGSRSLTELFNQLCLVKVYLASKRRALV